MNKQMQNRQPEELDYFPVDDHAQFLYTFDLGAATSLVSVGYELAFMDKSNPRKVRFAFKRESGIEETLDAYWSNDLNVQARMYFDNLKMVKNRIYSE